MSSEELEHERALLNHDKVKNAFMNKVGTVRSDLSLEERSKDIKIVWAITRGERPQNEDLEDIEATVRSGLAAWPNVLASLEDFFENGPKRCGYKGRNRLEETRQLFFRGDKSLTSVISRFVTEFNEIAWQSGDARKERLKEFWEVADAIHQTLTTMRPGIAEDALFGDYFEKM